MHPSLPTPSVPVSRNFHPHSESSPDGIVYIPLPECMAFVFVAVCGSHSTRAEATVCKNQSVLWSTRQNGHVILP